MRIHPIKDFRQVKDITGIRKGRLTVIRVVGIDDFGSTVWECKCDCGNVKNFSRGNLLRGNTNSCGCLWAENIAKQRKHGLSKKFPAEYHIWYSMIRRCTKPNHVGYKNYGGRGIVVCKRWLSDFGNFFADMGPRPSAEMLLERLDNDGNYCPKNCVWATPEAQANNTRGNRLITWDGRTQTMTQWSRERILPVGALYRRLKKGWPVEQALTTPVRPSVAREKRTDRR